MLDVDLSCFWKPTCGNTLRRIQNPLGQKQAPNVFYENGCSWKFRKIHRKTPVSESLFKQSFRPQSSNFIKKRLWHRCLPVNFSKFSRTFFNRTPLDDCFCLERLRKKLTAKTLFSHSTPSWIFDRVSNTSIIPHHHLHTYRI